MANPNKPNATDSKQLIVTDNDDLLLTRAEWEALLKESKENPQPQTASADALAIAGAIVGAIRETDPHKNDRIVVPYGKQRIATPFNPTGKRTREFPFPVFQNGARLSTKLSTDAEIELVAHLKPGRYLDRLVTVRQTVDEDTGDPGALDITYRTDSADRRMALGSRLTGEGKTGLERMLRLIIAEQAQNELTAKQKLRESLA